MRVSIVSALLAVTLVAALGSASQDAPASSLVGSWRLRVFEHHDPSGEVSHPFGKEPLGTLIYTANRRMSVHLVDPNRPSFSSGDFQQGTDEEVRSAFEGYFGYFGSYTVELTDAGADGQSGTVTHHVEGCAFPDYIGTDRSRSMVLNGDRLTLSTSKEENGEAVAWYRVVWERLR